MVNIPSLLQGFMHPRWWRISSINNVTWFIFRETGGLLRFQHGQREYQPPKKESIVPKEMKSGRLFRRHSMKGLHPNCGRFFRTCETLQSGRLKVNDHDNLHLGPMDFKHDLMILEEPFSSKVNIFYTHREIASRLLRLLPHRFNLLEESASLEENLAVASLPSKKQQIWSCRKIGVEVKELKDDDSIFSGKGASATLSSFCWTN